MPQSLRSGMQLFRNLDQSFTAMMAKATSVRKIDIKFRLWTEGNKIFLQATDEAGRQAEISAYIIGLVSRYQYVMRF